ncbi:MAG: hypothetical protein VX875_03460 [Pseudomonadota bacterium]|nr:hypothetical protein [Pseudomonadota bacterium]
MSQYIPYLLRMDLLQIDPLLDVDWRARLESIFTKIDDEHLKEEIDRQILQTKSITWSAQNNHFDSKPAISLDKLKFTMEDDVRILNILDHIIESLGFIEDNHNAVFFAEYVENIVRQINAIDSEDDLSLGDKLYQVKKSFLYHIAEIVKNKHFEIPKNTRGITQDELKVYILEVYIKHELLDYWFKRMSSYEINNEDNLYFKYIIRKEATIRKFSVVKTSKYYFLVAPGRSFDENIFSIRRYLLEQTVEHSPKVYIYTLALPLVASDEMNDIKKFKFLISNMVTVEYNLNQSVVDFVANTQTAFNNQIMPMFTQPIEFKESNMDLIVGNHLSKIENLIHSIILKPLKEAMSSFITHQDEYDYVYYTIKHMFQDMINSFDVFKQQPLLSLNTQVQVFGYKIISYMKMLERRRSDLFVNISAHELRMVGDVAKQPLDLLFESFDNKMSWYRGLQFELKEIERNQGTPNKKGALAGLFAGRNQNLKRYQEIYHEMMVIKKSAFQVVFKKLCHFLKLLKTGMMHYGNYI